MNKVFDENDEILSCGGSTRYLPEWNKWLDERLINKGPVCFSTENYMYFPEFKLNLETAKGIYKKKEINLILTIK